MHRALARRANCGGLKDVNAEKKAEKKRKRRSSSAGRMREKFKIYSPG